MLVVNDMMKDWSRKSIPKVMVDNHARSKKISQCLIILNNSVYLTYLFKPLFSYIFHPVEDRKFLAAVYFPFDGRQSPYYEIITVGQLILSFGCLNILPLIDGLLTFSVQNPWSN